MSLLSRSRLLSIFCILFAVVFSFGEYFLSFHQTLEEQEVELSSEELVGEEEASPEVFRGPKKVERLLHVGKGDTFSTLLKTVGISPDETHRVVQALKGVYNPRDLKIGQRVALCYQSEEGKSSTLLSLKIKPSKEFEIILTQQDGSFQAHRHNYQLIKKTKRIYGKIKASFYQAALKQNMPSNLVKEAARLLSYNINWQHDPKPGDPFEIIYDVYVNAQGEVVKTGQLRFVAFAPGGRLKQLYYFEEKKGFYNEKGESIVKSLLQTPIDPSKMRVSSKFGLRKDPFLQFTKYHAGIDLAAPIGTHVVAAGDGVVIKARWFGGYGRYILIKHPNGYSTAYGHLSKILVRPGQKVTQGSLIGHVGSSGRATAAHLHFELHDQNKKKINPERIHLLPSKKLAGKELRAFMKERKQIEKHVQISGPEQQYVLRPISAKAVRG